MGLTSHLSDAYDAFYFYRVSFSLILILMKMSLMTSVTMMVLVPVSPPVSPLVSPPVRAFLHFLNYLLIVLVYCHVMESLNLVAVLCNFSVSRSKASLVISSEFLI